LSVELSYDGVVSFDLDTADVSGESYEVTRGDNSLLFYFMI
jgi:hypothetical protein